jgi:undecaprenyl-diphosphatase
LLLEHTFRTVLGKPIPAAVFLMVNGAILYAAERMRRRAVQRGDDRVEPEHTADGVASDRRIATRGFGETTLIGAAQVLALLPGISRSGTTMAAGLSRGLDHEDAARFSFLLATPVIFAAGLLKIPDLTGPLGAGIGGQVLAGSAASFVCAYLSVRFLTRYFERRTLTPFAIYCALAGLFSLIWLTTH